MKNLHILAFAALMAGSAQAEITDRIEQKLSRVYTQLGQTQTSNAEITKSLRSDKKQTNKKETRKAAHKRRK